MTTPPSITPATAAPIPLEQLPLREIPGGYGLPLLGPIKDRLDFFWFQGEKEFWASRRKKFNSTVFRTNVAPSPPAFAANKVIMLLDQKSFPVLFDMDKIYKKDVLLANYMPPTSFYGGIRPCVYLDPSEERHTKLKSFIMSVLKAKAGLWVPEMHKAMTEIFASWDTNLEEKPAGYQFSSETGQVAFNVLIRTLLGQSPSTDELSPTAFQIWLGPQLLPIASVGLPHLLEELILHNIRIPIYIQQRPISPHTADNSPKPAETLVLQQPNSWKAEKPICKYPLPKSNHQHSNALNPSADTINWGMLSLEQSIIAYAQLDEYPSIHTSLCTLQKCKAERSLADALHLHLHICVYGLDTHFVLRSHLVSLFVECGSISSAQHAFNRLCQRSEFVWTCLLHGYVDSGDYQHALHLVQGMKEDGIVPTKFTYVALLKACARLQWLERGQELHEELGQIAIESDLFVGSALVNMYAKCGSLEKAQEAFDGLSDRSIVSWTALIAGYAEYGSGEKAMECLEQMHLEGISPDTGLYVCSLKACKNLEDLQKGYAMHSELVKRGFEEDQVVGHVLMDMYANCGSLQETRCVFDMLPSKNVVSWTILISRYADYGHNAEALQFLERMQAKGECPNDITLVSSLKACKDLSALDKGREIHATIVREELEKVPYVCNTLVDFYATHRLVEEAHEVFKELQIHDVVLWTTLITGYSECENVEEALNCFEQMQLQGVSPDVASFNAIILGCAVQDKAEDVLRMYLQLQEQGILPNSSTFMSALKACKNKSVLAFGKTVHAQLLTSSGQEAIEIQLATVLFDMYAKCGSMLDAQYVFDSLPSKDIVAWTALITGYAGRGESNLVFELLERMKGEGMWLDEEAFLSVLIACAHAGLVDEGLILFESMSKDFGIVPTLEHINCIVDLVGRVGRLNEAVTMLKQSLIPPDQVMWATVLAACRKWHDVQVARHAFECAITLDKSYTAVYSLMANIYADAQMWEEMKIVEAMRIEEG